MARVAKIGKVDALRVDFFSTPTYETKHVQLGDKIKILQNRESYAEESIIGFLKGVYEDHMVVERHYVGSDKYTCVFYRSVGYIEIMDR